MAVNADSFGGPVVAAPGKHVLHVVFLGAAFEVVRVNAFRVVALVSYDRWPVEVGDEERETVDCPVFPRDVEVAVAIGAP